MRRHHITAGLLLVLPFLGACPASESVLTPAPVTGTENLPVLSVPNGYLVFTIHTEHNRTDVRAELGKVDLFLAGLADDQHVTVQLQSNYVQALTEQPALLSMVEGWRQAGHEIGIHKHAYLQVGGSDCYTNTVDPDCLMHDRDIGDPCNSVSCQDYHGAGRLGTNRASLKLFESVGLMPAGGGISMKDAASAIPDPAAFRTINSRSEFADFVCDEDRVASCMRDDKLVYLNHNFSSNRCYGDGAEGGGLDAWVHEPPCGACGDSCTLSLADTPSADGAYCSGVLRDPVKVAVSDGGFSYYSVGMGSKVFAYLSATAAGQGADEGLAYQSAAWCMGQVIASDQPHVIAYAAHSYNLPAVDSQGKPVIPRVFQLAADNGIRAITQRELIETQTGHALGDGRFSTSGLPPWPDGTEAAKATSCQCMVGCGRSLCMP